MRILRTTISQYSLSPNQYARYNLKGESLNLFSSQYKKDCLRIIHESRALESTQGCLNFWKEPAVNFMSTQYQNDGSSGFFWDSRVSPDVLIFIGWVPFKPFIISKTSSELLSVGLDVSIYWQIAARATFTPLKDLFFFEFSSFLTATSATLSSFW